jgi:hypothetical protein
LNVARMISSFPVHWTGLSGTCPTIMDYRTVKWHKMIAHLHPAGELQALVSEWSGRSTLAGRAGADRAPVNTTPATATTPGCGARPTSARGRPAGVLIALPGTPVFPTAPAG